MKKYAVIFVVSIFFSRCSGAEMVQDVYGMHLVSDGSACRAVLTPACVEGNNFSLLLKFLRKSECQNITLDCFAPIKNSDLIQLLYLDTIVAYHFWNCENIANVALALIDREYKLTDPEEKFIVTLISNNFIPNLVNFQDLYFFPDPETFGGNESVSPYKEVIQDGVERMQDAFLSEFFQYSAFAQWALQ